VIQPTETTWDAVVVGAGPAGCAAARILAEKGRRVLILERETFPRYKVGESLIPYCWFPLNRLGMVEKLNEAAYTVKKHSVQFVGLDGKVSAPFYFFKHTDHDCARTWQVLRSDFDQAMLDHALEAGAQVRMGTAAKSLMRDDRGTVIGVTTNGPDGTGQIRARVTVDASGRDLFAVGRNDWRVDDPELRKIAVWSYFENGKRDEGIDEGATTVAYVPEKGWFWYIPLPENTVSVGIVAERDYLYRAGKGDPDAILKREIAIQPWIADHLSAATQKQPAKVTGDYSYRSRHCAEDGLVLVGDAFAFLDPVFSSGVFLALQSGGMAGDAIDTALEAGDVSAQRFEGYARELKQGIEAMRRLVYAFYETDFSFGDFLKKHPEFRGDLTDCLIGHLQKDFDPMFAAVAEFADVPAPLPHGGPLTSRETTA